MILNILTTNQIFQLRYFAARTYARCRVFWIIWYIEALLMARCFEHWRAALSRVKCFQTFCHQFFKAVDLIPQSIKGTAFVLVLPRSQQAAVFQTYRFALWGVGNLTHFASTFAFLTCVLAVFIVTRHKRLSIWLRS